MKIESITLREIQKRLKVAVRNELRHRRTTAEYCSWRWLRMASPGGAKSPRGKRRVQRRDDGDRMARALRFCRSRRDRKRIGGASEFPALVGHIRGHEMAKSGSRMRCGTWRRNSSGVPLSNLLGGTLEEIACGVSLGIRETPQSLVRRVEEELRSGYQRIKLKIKPAKDLRICRGGAERIS